MPVQKALDDLVDDKQTKGEIEKLITDAALEVENELLTDLPVTEVVEKPDLEKLVDEGKVLD